MYPDNEKAEVLTCDGERFVTSGAIQQSGWLKVVNVEGPGVDEFRQPNRGIYWLSPGP